jgi:aldehyde dehydrogenase family protein
MVSFTGSSAVGRQAMASASATMKRMLLECGRNSAAVILDELLQRILFKCCTLAAGQAGILNSRLLPGDGQGGGPTGGGTTALGVTPPRTAHRLLSVGGRFRPVGAGS